MRRFWQSHNVAWRNREALAPSSIFSSKKHQSAESLSWAPPSTRHYRPIWSPMGVWIWDEAFHLFFDTAENPWTACPNRMQLTGSAVDLVKKRKNIQKTSWGVVELAHLHQDGHLSQSGKQVDQFKMSGIDKPINWNWRTGKSKKEPMIHCFQDDLLCLCFWMFKHQ